MGYSDLDSFIGRLLKRGYVIEAQTQFSAELLEDAHKGLFVPYPEKSQAGLSITDCRAAVSIRVSTATLRAFHRDPAAGGQQFAVYRKPRPARPRAPPGQPCRGLASLCQGCVVSVAKRLHLPGQSAGGSTLATQLETAYVRAECSD